MRRARALALSRGRRYIVGATSYIAAAHARSTAKIHTRGAHTASRIFATESRFLTPL